MDISTVVAVLVLIALFLGAVVWMEVQSRKTGSKEGHRDAKNPDLSEMEIGARYSTFPMQQRDEAVANKVRTREREL